MDEFLVFEIGYSSNEIWNELSRARKVLKIGQFSATKRPADTILSLASKRFFLFQRQKQKQGHKHKDARQPSFQILFWKMTVNYRVILWHWWQFLTYWGTQIMIFVKVRWQLEIDNGQFLQSLKMKRYGVPLLGRGQAFLVPPFFWSAVSKNWVKRRPNCRFQWSSTHLLHFYRLGHGEWQWMKMKENVGHWRALKENEEGHWMTM